MIISNIIKMIMEAINKIHTVENPALRYFTVGEYLKHHAKLDDLDIKRKDNTLELLHKVDIIRERYGRSLIVTSGYRPEEYNESIGGARNSAHITCQAIDLFDPNGDFKCWLRDNIGILDELDLYMESARYTQTWVHLQTRPTKSRVFKP